MFMRPNFFVSMLVICALAVGVAQAGIGLEFFVGTSQNDTTISGVSFPGGAMTLTQGGAPGFIQVVLRQTAPTTLLDANDGLAAYLTQGVYGANQPNTFIVPATNGLPTGTTPVVNVANPGTYSLVRSYRTGVNGSSPGGTAATATAVRFGGLNLNPPPSPSVDANGRIFLGTVRIDPNNLLLTTQNSSIIFQDPNPAPGTIDNITDMGDNIDAVLYNGQTYTLPITVNPVPEPAGILVIGFLATGVLARRPMWR